MDEVVVQASIRQKLRQKIKKSSNRLSKSVIYDKNIDRQVKQTLASNQSDDRPTPDQCIQFFTAMHTSVDEEDQSPEKELPRPLTTRFKPGIGKYQTQESGKDQNEQTEVKSVRYDPLDDGIAVSTPPNGSLFFQKPISWPTDSVDIDTDNNKKPLHKMVSMKGLTSVCDELFPCQLSTPLLKSQELEDESLDLRDPYDPETIRLRAVLNSFKPREKERPLEDSLSFCSLEDELSKPRMRMLLMRASGAPHLRHVAVPLNEREVPLSLLLTNDQRHKDLKTNGSDLSGRKENAIRIRDEVQQKLLFNSQSRGQRILTLQDLVHEEETTAIDFAYNFFSASDDRRRLHPVRKERKKRVTASGENVDIIITVMHASNLPLRTTRPGQELESMEKRKQSLSALEATRESMDPGQNQVTPFVEAVFQRQSVRTSVADGSQATWNQTLDLNLKSPNGDLSPATLSKIKDNIILNVFDEVVSFPKVSGSQDQESLPAPRVDRRWLGCLSIPFSTLYLNTRIEGTFAIDSPVALLDYEFESTVTPSSHRKSHSSKKEDISSSNAVLLTLFLTIDPPLQKLQEMDLNCDTDEDEGLVTYARQFDAECMRRFPERKFRSVVVSMDCKWVFVTRYLRPLRPPEVFHDSLVMEEVMRRLARYVSLIPSHAEFSSTGVVKDIWLTCDQFLDIGSGDEEEHAILLCNFFLYLGRRAGLVIGMGIPEGLTCYVITYEYSSEDTSVWNACTGQRYRVSEPFIPLTSVSAVVMMENVYVNVQSYSHPNRLNFDLDKSSNWTPLFNKKTEKLFPHMSLTSVQPEVLNFPVIGNEEVKGLQDQLEKHIKSCLMRWRPKSPTFFNRSSSQRLKKLLIRLEKQAHAKRGHKVDVESELKDMLSMYRVTGFPLLMRYSDMDSVTEALFATGVHVTDDPKVEFAVAVHVVAYPANVLSLSVYVAALHLIVRT